MKLGFCLIGRQIQRTTGGWCDAMRRSDSPVAVVISSTFPSFRSQSHAAAGVVRHGFFHPPSRHGVWRHAAARGRGRQTQRLVRFRGGCLLLRSVVSAGVRTGQKKAWSGVRACLGPRLPTARCGTCIATRRAAVPKTQTLVHLCSSDAVCGEKNHHTVEAFGTILGLFSPPPQETWSQTRPKFIILFCEFF